MFIIYSSPTETIVTTEEKDHETFLSYFTNGGRNPDDYDRLTSDGIAVDIKPILIASSEYA